MAVSAGVVAPVSTDWARKYPPLVALAAALLIALAVLPSALNLPQSNPTTTLEFAPVPPDDENSPPIGNLSSLGLASSGSLEGGGALGGDEGGLEDLIEDVKRSTTKNCVILKDGRPHQDPDPLSPPCVAEWPKDADNGGATYPGVTRDEVRILFYFQGFGQYVNLCRDPNQVTPDGKYFDLAEPEQEGEFCAVRVLRNMQKYFNEHYQTYGRFVHFFVYFSGQGVSAEERKADAADNYDKVHPFAVLSTANSFSQAYLESMAKRGVLNFGSFAGQLESFFQRYPKLIWGYLPSVENQARIFSSYICKEVNGRPVTFSGPALLGQQRKFGLYGTADAEHPELQALDRFTEKYVKEECGIEFAVKRYKPYVGFFQDNRYSPRVAQDNAQAFADAGVTTIIWPGGYETPFSRAAAAQGYLPEVVAAGDLVLETDTNGTFEDQNFWNHVRVVANVTAVENERTQRCYYAYKEVDPEGDDFEIRSVACVTYPLLRQMFTGIQVAGPRLGPASVDKGFHAIPKIASIDPSVPACFYNPGDYTCVKDGVAEHWDSTGDGGDGCYRMTQGGKRYFAGTWPDGNVTDFEKPDDPCNHYDDSFIYNPQPPEPSEL